jgi:hypothetical protein
LFAVLLDEAFMGHIAKHRWRWDAGFLIAAAGVAVLVYAIMYL